MGNKTEKHVQSVYAEKPDVTGTGREAPLRETGIIEGVVDKPVDNGKTNLSDFALFLSVLKVKDAYEDVLSIILDEPDLELKEVKVEQVILNQSGKRAIRLDAWASDLRERQFDMDTPVLKSGKETRYKNLPSTVIIFITQEDIFGRDRAMYTFSERCEEVPDLPLGDGTSKIFLNMMSINGRPELVSLLQYMKCTTLSNVNVTVKDERILDLDRIVEEVRQSEEWEAVRMNILEIGFEQGKEMGIKAGLEEGREKGKKEGIKEGIKRGTQKGSREMLVRNVEAAMKNFSVDLHKACEGLGVSVEEYEEAKRQSAQ